MKIVVVITGASGIIYGKRLVDILKKSSHEIKVIVTSAAKKVAGYENVILPVSDYNENDIAADIASGTSAPDVMVIVPCSLKTLGKISNGLSDNLVSRSAEVVLKERKKLVLVTRETPLSLITIKNMERLTLAGGIILPACPGFYHNPTDINGLIDFIVVKILNIINVKHNLNIKWKQKGEN